MKLEGCFTAIVTPFRHGAVDFDALGRLIERQIANGVDGLVPVGTTGESPTLDFKEHEQVIEFTTEAVNGRCKVIAGTGGNSTQEAVQLTKHAAAEGVDATLQVTPYYNKPSQEGLYRHFMEVAEHGGLPVVLYHVPGRTGLPIAIDTVCRLAGHPQIVAIKEATGDLDRSSELVHRCPELSVLSGDDALTLPRMIVGGKGVISVAANVAPGLVAEMVHAALRGDWQQARQLHGRLYPLFRDLFIDTNPVPVKAALAMMGRIEEIYRLPLCAMTDAQKAQVQKTLTALALL